jgi:arylsulfatase A-like enzyme
MITLDSLRPDHLGCYGYSGTETPHFDELAADGVRFTNAYCQAPNTWMSHAALFTGCNPPRNGVRSPLGRLNPQLPTIAERLKQLGYSTFGLPCVSLLSREAGFARGFDVYHLEGLLSEFHGAVHFRDLRETLDLFREWLAAAKPPWFAWLHYFGIHVVQGNPRDGRFNLLDVPPSDLSRFSPFAQHYDAKIAYADREFLGPTLQIAHRESGAEQLVTALFSDHGDDLNAIETGLPGHDTHLAEHAVRVPLVLHAPGRVSTNTVIDTPVRLIDVYPTLLELAGDAHPGGPGLERNPGAPPPDGLSLAPLCDGLAETVPRDVYLENLYQGFVALRQDRFKLVLSSRPAASLYRRHLAWRWQNIATALMPDRLLRPLRERRRLRRQRRRFHLPADTLCRQLMAPDSRAQLFDLHADPGERNDLAAAKPQVVSALRERLARLSMGERIAAQGYTAEEEAAIHQRLDDLGYL